MFASGIRCSKNLRRPCSARAYSGLCYESFDFRGRNRGSHPRLLACTRWWATRPPASLCWPAKVRLWPWWGHTFLPANCTALTVTMSQRLDDTRICLDHSFSISRRRHSALPVLLRPSRTSRYSCEIRSSGLWLSSGLRILLSAAISPIRLPSLTTNRGS